MAVIVIGGQCRKAGKTAVGCALIAALKEFSWTAIKISTHEHLSGESSFVEQSVSHETDTGRYLVAGAERAILISGNIASGNIADILSRVRQEIESSDMTLIESNRVLEFIKPDVLLFILDAESADFKESALRWVARSDALLIRSTVVDTLAPGAPRFVVGPDNWAPVKLIEFLGERLKKRQG